MFMNIISPYIAKVQIESFCMLAQRENTAHYEKVLDLVAEVEMSETSVHKRVSVASGHYISLSRWGWLYKKVIKVNYS